MSLAVHITPSPATIATDNGIGQVVHHIARLLPDYGITLVDDPAQADVTACHISADGPVDCQHVHGLYFDDLPHAPYSGWHHEANRRIVATARQARAITVPSPWVAECFRRDMRLTPETIGHGVNLADWPVVSFADRKPYALWNKNRPGDVCSPGPALALAQRGAPVVTTFAPAGTSHTNMITVGPRPWSDMRRLIRHASVYLATTIETFGIGTLEAMAASVPVVGYDWGGTADLVRHRIDGFLVPPDDLDALAGAVGTLLSDPTLIDTMGTYARERAAQYSWEAAAAKYAALYRRIADEKASERHRVCVVVTSYNYGQYLQSAAESVLPQMQPGDELRIVNDGSTDNTHDVANAIEQAHYGQDRIEVRHHTQHNSGVAAARNNGIAATDCEYIICLDADDQLAPDYIRLCRDALKADRGLGIAYTGLGLMRPEGGVTPSQFPPPFDWEVQAAPGNPPRTTVPTAAMFRRDLWARAGGYKQVHAPGEDAEFYTRILSLGATARKVADEPLIWYRNHGDGASKRLAYKAIDPYHPWMHDQRYPMAAPASRPVPVRSYHRPTVSVVIPCGPGHARYLPAAIESLLGQRYRGWEVIVIDDTGAPGAVEMALTPYPFVRLIKPNDKIDAHATIGPGAARNAGTQAATAPLILYLDADDWLTRSDALSSMLAAHIATGAYIYTDWVSSRDGQPHETPEYSQAAWLEQGQHAITALIPAEWAKATPFDETIKGWEDWKFYIDLALKGHCGHRLAQPFLGYRFESGTQRDQSLANKDHLLPQLRQYVQGKTPMACGCSAAARVLRSIQQELDMADLPPDLTAQPGQTLMEFTGSPNAGTARINSRSVRDPDTGRLARYEYGGGVRFLAVWDADVGFLESLGDFRRAGAAAAPEVPAAPMQVQTPVAPPAAAPEAAGAVLGASEAVPVSAADLETGMQQALADAERLSAQKAEQAAQTVRRRGRK